MTAKSQPWRVVPMTQGFVAIVSAEDFRRVSKHSWHTHMSAGSRRSHGQPYARACIDGRKVYLHRLIAGAPEDMHVDHKNRQTLDCRRENLEITTPAENQARKRKPKRG